MKKEELTTRDIVKIVCEGLGSGKPIDNKDGTLIFQTVCHNAPHSGKHKLYYYISTQLFHCYTECSDSFDIIELVTRARHCSVGEAMKFITEITGNYAGRVGFGDKNNEQNYFDDYDYDRNKDVAEDVNPPISKHYLRMFDRRPPYLWLKEGISVRAMKKFNIMFDHASNKIIVPHFDIDDNLIGIRGRALNKFEIMLGNKYMPIQMDCHWLAHALGSNLYGLNLNKENIRTAKKVILFEGEKSVMKYDDYSNGNNIALAVCGSSISNTQIKLLESLGVEEVIIAFDKMYHISPSEEASEYRNKLVKLGLKFPASMSVYYLWDDNNLTEYKNAPIDHGNKIFKILLSMKKLIKNKVENNDGEQNI